MEQGSLVGYLDHASICCYDVLSLHSLTVICVLLVLILEESK